jgi:hypothetical protein
MFELDNRTDWSAALYPGWSRDGKRQQTLVFKVGYRFNPAGKLDPLPFPPIEEADRYRGDPETSSLAVAGEIAPFKKGGELLIYGSAHSGGPGQSVLKIQVSLRQRNNDFWSKELRVLGPRTWQRKLLAAIPGPPRVIEEPVPLVYENAYGGTDPANPEKTFPGNPVGVGFSQRGLRTKGLSLPQIECGPDFIASPASRVTPAGFGPLAPHWQPRCKQKVDIDEHAIAAGGCPWKNPPPESLYNTAPLDQRFDQPFDGELSLKLKGLVTDTPQDVLINLPEIRPLIQMEMQESSSALSAECDTLIVHAERMEIYLIFRRALPLSGKNNDNGSVILQDPASETQKDRDRAEAMA